jgi:hypothetical protein
MVLMNHSILGGALRWGALVRENILHLLSFSMTRKRRRNSKGGKFEF